MIKSKLLVMAEGSVSWKSVKQTLIAYSTMEAKYVACYEAICHAIWLRNFISALEVVHSISRPLKLFCDNSVIVSFFKNIRSTSRFKHIDVKFFFVKENVATPKTGLTRLGGSEPKPLRMPCHHSITQNHIVAEAISKFGKPINIFI